MAYIIKRGSRYMTGHSYATGMGYRFSWSSDPSKARRIADDDASTDVFASQTRGKIVHVENTRKELRDLGRRAMRLR
jgi:hypothetical protein